MNIVHSSQIDYIEMYLRWTNFLSRWQAFGISIENIEIITSFFKRDTLFEMGDEIRDLETYIVLFCQRKDMIHMKFDFA